MFFYSLLAYILIVIAIESIVLVALGIKDKYVYITLGVVNILTAFGFYVLFAVIMVIAGMFLRYDWRFIRGLFEVIVTALLGYVIFKYEYKKLVWVLSSKYDVKLLFKIALYSNIATLVFGYVVTDFVLGQLGVAF